jgi:hypothetical protein
MKEGEIINQVLTHIKDQIGIELELDEYFSGLQTYKKETFFNVELEKPTFQSHEADKLRVLATQSRLITDIRVNGYKRLAVFFDMTALST